MLEPCEDYYGAGAGAHSFRHGPPKGSAPGNVDDPWRKYLRRVEDQVTLSRGLSGESCRHRTLAAETLMLGLRLSSKGSTLHGPSSANIGSDPVELFPEALNLGTGAGDGWKGGPASNRIAFTVEEGMHLLRRNLSSPLLTGNIRPFLEPLDGPFHLSGIIPLSVEPTVSRHRHKGDSHEQTTILPLFLSDHSSSWPSPPAQRPPGRRNNGDHLSPSRP